MHLGRGVYAPFISSICFLRGIIDGFRAMARELPPYLQLDRWIALFAVLYLALYAPLIARNTDSPRLVAAFVNDEPFLVMALEGMLISPYGNPGNYFDTKSPNSDSIPAHWGSLRYPNIIYYGGAMYALAFPPYALLRAIGLPPFPTGPIILRTITLLAGLLSLVVLYNFAKIRGAAFAGLLGCVVLMSDRYFFYYSLYIHPDTLQLLIGLFAFLMASAHARSGDRGTLISLGLLCGIVQGTKVGGPWTVPMALLAVAIGLSTREPTNARPSDGPWFARGAREFTTRLLILAGAALLGFFLSTPYAFLGGYYFESMSLAFFANIGDFVQQKDKISLWSWIIEVHREIGLFGTMLVAMVVLRAAISNWRRISDPALILGVVLSLSQLLWYGATGKIWIVTGYMLLALGLMAVLGFETLLVVGRRLLAEAASIVPSARRPLQAVWIAALSVFLAVLLLAKLPAPLFGAVPLYLSSRSTVRAINDWAIARTIPADAVILHDDLSYFDLKRFPKARMNGGILTWTTVETVDPDYIVLSSSLFAANWVNNLIKTQHLTRHSSDWLNVWLYQELLATDTPGPTRIPGIELDQVIKANSELLAEAQRSKSPLAGLMSYCEQVVRSSPYSLCQSPLHDLRPFLTGFSRLFAAIIERSSTDPRPLVGPELRVYRVNRAGTPNGRPSAFGIGSVDGYEAAYAFDGAAASAWVCKPAGDTENRCALGYDFGVGARQQVKTVRVTWVDGTTMPLALQIDCSDDKVTWTTAAKFVVRPYEQSATANRADTFVLPSAELHRYWRVKLTESAPEGALAIAELSFHAE